MGQSDRTLREISHSETVTEFTALDGADVTDNP